MTITYTTTLGTQTTARSVDATRRGKFCKTRRVSACPRCACRARESREDPVAIGYRTNMADGRVSFLRSRRPYNVHAHVRLTCHHKHLLNIMCVYIFVYIRRVIRGSVRIGRMKEEGTDY